MFYFKTVFGYFDFKFFEFCVFNEVLTFIKRQFPQKDKHETKQRLYNMENNAIHTKDKSVRVELHAPF